MVFINLIRYLCTENFPMRYTNVSFKYQILFKNATLEKTLVLYSIEWNILLNMLLGLPFQH